MEMYERPVRVMAAVPVAGMPQPLFVETLFRVCRHVRKWCDMDVRLFRGYSCEMARNMAVEEFLKTDADYLWMVDDDTALADDTLERLVEAGADIVSAICFRKLDGVEDRVAEVFRSRGDGEVENYTESQLPEGVFEVEIAGGGCILIRREVIGRCAEVSDGGRVFVYQHDPLISEDFWFCNLAHALGYRIMAHSGAKVGHIGTTVY